MWKLLDSALFFAQNVEVVISVRSLILDSVNDYGLICYSYRDMLLKTVSYGNDIIIKFPQL